MSCCVDYSLSSFCVKEVSEDAVSEVEAVCQKWSKIVQKYLHLAVSAFERAQLENCGQVCFHIEKQIFNENILKKNGVCRSRRAGQCIRLFAKDLTENIQAIVVAQLFEKSLEIKYIVTNPENLMVSNRFGFKPMRGAASFLIQYLKAQAALQNIFKITVEAFKDAVGFYKKLGFAFDSNEELEGAVFLMNWCDDAYVHRGF